MKRIIGFIMCVVIALNMSSIHVAAQNIKDEEIYAQGAVLMDAASGRVLYGKNPDLQLAMASTTKIMTCIAALELGGEDEVVTASAYAAAQPKVKLYLRKGEQLFLHDLLYSMMLESHNDAAAAVAEHLGARLLGWPVDCESVVKRTEAESKEAIKAFSSYMNQKARELQCYHTWFITPNGLDATESFFSEEGIKEERFHSTTAAELARIMSYCILQSPASDVFLEITGTYSYGFSDVEKTRSFVCRNHNAFLNMMEGALSGKTGYTGRAGYCYVGALKHEENYFVVALLNTGAYGGSNKTRKWQDTRRLMEYGIANYHMRQVYDGNTPAVDVPVKNARPRDMRYFEKVFVETAVAGDAPVELVLAEWETVSVRIKRAESLEAPVRAGQIVGSVELLLEGNIIRQYDIVCMEHILEKKFTDTLQYIGARFLFTGK